MILPLVDLLFDLNGSSCSTRSQTLALLFPSESQGGLGAGLHLTGGLGGQGDVDFLKFAKFRSATDLSVRPIDSTDGVSGGGVLWP